MTSLVVHEFKNSPIEQRASDGYFNLTSMCAIEGKKVNDYLRLELLGIKERAVFFYALS